MQETAARRLSRMFQLIAFSMKEEKERLSDLDGAIGDADHGITMVLGFSAINSALAKLDLEHILPSEIFAAAAAAFLDTVGASTGPLYATAFRHASRPLNRAKASTPRTRPASSRRSHEAFRNAERDNVAIKPCWMHGYRRWKRLLTRERTA